MLSEGLIIKINSDLYTVKIDDEILECKSRGKFRNDKITPLVGDHVLVDKSKNLIMEVKERKNYLLRPPVANIDIALIVTSFVEPSINYNLLDKLISVITINNITPVILLSKLDLGKKQELKELNKVIKYYKHIGIKVFKNNEIFRLKRFLKGHIVTVCGQTGAGKSTFINKLDKKLNLNTDEISKSLGRGKHTTRIVQLFDLNKFYIVDTPGFSSIELKDYSKEDIKNSFIEFRNNNCKYKDCNHIKEDGCEIISKVNNKEILRSRYESFLSFVKESK